MPYVIVSVGTELVPGTDEGYVLLSKEVGNSLESVPPDDSGVVTGIEVAG